MITTLKQFEVRSKETGNLISRFTLRLNGYHHEVIGLNEVLFSGIEADLKYKECLETNRLIVEKMDNMEIIETK